MQQRIDAKLVIQDHQSRNMVGSWHHAAKALISHFHAICHGDVAFALDWDTEDQKSETSMDEESRRFVSQLKELLVADGQSGL